MAAEKKLTQAQRISREKAIIKDLQAGKMSYRVIAEKHKVSLPTVNAKARKAGITRTRRGPAAKKVTSRKVTRVARTTMKTKKPTLRKKATRKVAKKTVARKKVTRRKVTRVVGRKSRSIEKFQSQFKDLVMNFYPNMSLKAYEKLNKVIAKALT